MSGPRVALTLVSVACAGLLAACADRSPAPKEDAPSADVALGGELVAKLTSETAEVRITSALVGAVARERGVSPREATSLLVDDGVLELAALSRGLDRHDRVAWQLVAARGRLFADRLRGDVRAEGPITDAEVRELSERSWREVDRPEAVRVVHAVVRMPVPASPDALSRARDLAKAIRDAVTGAPDSETFIARAKAVPHEPELAVVAETLPAFTRAGAATEGLDHFSESFAVAAHAVGQPKELSPVIETEHGFHVIMLLERLPEQRMPFESRRTAFAEEAYALRARRKLEAELEALRAKHPVAIAPSAEELMRAATVEAR